MYANSMPSKSHKQGQDMHLGKCLGTSRKFACDPTWQRHLSMGSSCL